MLEWGPDQAAGDLEQHNVVTLIPPILEMAYFVLQALINERAAPELLMHEAELLERLKSVVNSQVTCNLRPPPTCGPRLSQDVVKRRITCWRNAF